MRTIGDPPPSRKQAGEMLFPVLHNPGEKNWRSIPSPGGTVEDSLQRLGETGDLLQVVWVCRGGGLAPTPW